MTENNISSNYSHMTNMANVALCSLVNGTLNNTNCTNSTSVNEASIQYAGYRCDEGSHYLRWFGDVVITPPIVVFGVIGNILSFITLCAQKPNMTTTILLRYLAVIDTLILLAGIPLRTFRQIQICHNMLNSIPLQIAYTKHIYMWLFPCTLTLRLAGTWITCVLTIDRHIAVSRPLHAQRIITNKVAIVQIVGITIGSMLLTLPFFFERQVNISAQGILSIPNREYATAQWYLISYRVVLWSIVAYLIPIAIMVILNTRLVQNLRVAAQHRSLLQRSASSESAQMNYSVTAIVVTVVVTFLVCNVTVLISQMLYSLEQCFHSLAEPLGKQRAYMATINNILVTLNSAVNFLIYCVCSSSFRATFVRVFCCDKLLHLTRRAHNRESNGSANTYFSKIPNGSHDKFCLVSKQSSNTCPGKLSTDHKSGSLEIYG